MNAVATLQPRRSITAAVAAQYGMEPGPFEQTLRRTVVPSECTREEFAAFLLVAKHYGLNPILREIYAFPKKGGGIQPIVGVDGWSTMINRQDAFDGMEFEDHFDEDENLVSITCRMYRKDRAHAVSATEYFVECKRDVDTWRRWPRRMLRHKAMIQAARYAFGFSGVIDPDEYDRFGASPHDPAMLRAQMQIENGSGDVDEDPQPPPTEAEQALADDGEFLDEIRDRPVEASEGLRAQLQASVEREDLLSRLREASTPARLLFSLSKLTDEQRSLITDADRDALKKHIAAKVQAGK